MVKNKSVNLWFVFLGSLLLLVLLTNGGLPRAAVVYDGEDNMFQLEISGEDLEGAPGDLFVNRLRITNPGAGGSMYVQCSILSKSEYDFLNDDMLQDRAAITYLPINENCKPNEPFTQTAVFSLVTGATAIYDFSMKVPDIKTQDAVMYCSAYEQCWQDGPPGISHEVYVPFTVLQDEEPSNNPSYETVDFSNEAVKEWVGKNSILLWGLAIALLLVGFFAVFKEPKIKGY